MRDDRDIVDAIGELVDFVDGQLAKKPSGYDRQAARQHLILASSHRAATTYARQHGFGSRPLIITRREGCRGIDPSRYVIHYLGNPDLLDEIRMRLHNGVTLESLMYTPGDQAA